MNTQNAVFIKSAVASSDFIADGRAQIVFAGRSNVGKSSVINKLLNRKNFARKSATPGKTAHVNYFLIDDALYFVDPPGYGYAKVSYAEQNRWADIIGLYLELGRPPQGANVLIVDSRHKPSEDDKAIFSVFLQEKKPLIILANKTDKLKKSELAEKLSDIKAYLGIGADVKLIPFSAETGEGRSEFLAYIDELYGGNKDEVR